MKKILALCLAVFAFSNIFSQAKDPVKWMATYKSISVTEGEIIITASIDKTWHTYSQKATTDGPVPTSFIFTPSKQFSLVVEFDVCSAQEGFVYPLGVEIYL